MARPRIELVLELMDRAFSGSEHSLLNNLATVEADSWSKVPDGGKRSIQEITRHVGMFKFMYANHAFRGGDLDYSDDPATPPPERVATVDDAVEWLREGHAYLTEGIRELDDDGELEAPTQGPLGRPAPHVPHRRDYTGARPIPRGRDQPHPRPAPGRRRMVRARSSIG